MQREVILPMGRIKIEDLPQDMEISREEMRKILGGSQLKGSSLSSVVGSAGNEMDDLRNTRQENMTGFENADQKANQYVNTLSTVMKATKEMGSAVVKNIK